MKNVKHIKRILWSGLGLKDERHRDEGQKDEDKKTNGLKDEPTKKTKVQKVEFHRVGVGVAGGRCRLS